MKQTIKQLSTALALAAATATATTVTSQDFDRSEKPMILVTGNAETSAAPDLAVVQLGATIQSAQAAEAQSMVNKIVKETLDEIEKLNIPKRAIKSARITLSPVYAQQRPDAQYDPKGPKVVGYRASNTIEVTLDDLTRVGKVIDAGIKTGANELQGVSFTLKNDLPQRQEALTKAAQEARSKAEVIAKALDLRLGSVFSVNENGVSVMPHMEKFATARMAAANYSTPVEPGEVKVQATVTVRYNIAH